MWITLLTGVAIGVAAGLVLGRLAKRGKPWTHAILGAVAGGLLAYTYAAGGTDFPQARTSEQFRSMVLEAPRPVMVDFYTDSCIACRMLAPKLEALAKEHAGEVDFVGVNVGYANELGDEFEIRAVPTVILFVGGQPVRRWVGAYPAEEYRSAIESVTGQSQQGT